MGIDKVCVGVKSKDCVTYCVEPEPPPYLHVFLQLRGGMENKGIVDWCDTMEEESRSTAMFSFVDQIPPKFEPHQHIIKASGQP